MFDLLDLIDCLELLSCFSFASRYDGESLYWRFMGLFLLVAIVGVWLLNGVLGMTVAIVASIVFGLWLIVHLVIRSSMASTHNEE